MQWMALAEVDGWGREEHRNAELRATIWNALLLLGAKTTRVSPRKDEWREPADYLPDYAKQEASAAPVVPATPATPEQKWQQTRAALNGLSGM